MSAPAPRPRSRRRRASRLYAPTSPGCKTSAMSWPSTGRRLSPTPPMSCPPARTYIGLLRSTLWARPMSSRLADCWASAAASTPVPSRCTAPPTTRQGLRSPRARRRTPIRPTASRSCSMRQRPDNIAASTGSTRLACGLPPCTDLAARRAERPACRAWSARCALAVSANATCGQTSPWTCCTWPTRPRAWLTSCSAPRRSMTSTTSPVRL